jgi:hypothetical protein
MKKLTLLQWAKAGLPLKTQDGRKATFVCYIRNADRKHRLICLVDGKVFKRQVNGKHCDTCSGSVYPSIIKDEAL